MRGENISADERNLHHLAVLCLDTLVLIENEIAERIKIRPLAVAFARLHDVWMMADDERGARVDGRVRKSNLGRGRLRACTRFRDASIRSQRRRACGFPAHPGRRFSDPPGDARIDILPIAILLIVGIAEEAEPDAMPHKHDAFMRGLRRFTAADWLYAMGYEARPL